jgi:hypothetical protein
MSKTRTNTESKGDFPYLTDLTAHNSSRVANIDPQETGYKEFHEFLMLFDNFITKSQTEIEKPAKKAAILAKLVEAAEAGHGLAQIFLVYGSLNEDFGPPDIRHIWTYIERSWETQNEFIIFVVQLLMHLIENNGDMPANLNNIDHNIILFSQNPELIAAFKNYFFKKDQIALVVRAVLKTKLTMAQQMMVLLEYAANGENASNNAKSLLAMMLALGKEVKQDEARAKQLFRSSAETTGCELWGCALTELGGPIIIPEMKKLAEQCEAQFIDLHSKQLGMPNQPVRNLNQAVEYFREPVEGQRALVNLVKESKCFPKELALIKIFDQMTTQPVEAFQNLQQLAEQGNMHAQLMLAFLILRVASDSKAEQLKLPADKRSDVINCLAADAKVCGLLKQSYASTKSVEVARDIVTRHQEAKPDCTFPLWNRALSDAVMLVAVNSSSTEKNYLDVMLRVLSSNNFTSLTELAFLFMDGKYLPQHLRAAFFVIVLSSLAGCPLADRIFMNMTEKFALIPSQATTLTPQLERKAKKIAQRLNNDDEVAKDFSETDAKSTEETIELDPVALDRAARSHKLISHVQKPEDKCNLAKRLCVVYPEDAYQLVSAAAEAKHPEAVTIMDVMSKKIYSGIVKFMNNKILVKMGLQPANTNYGESTDGIALALLCSETALYQTLARVIVNRILKMQHEAELKQARKQSQLLQQQPKQAEKKSQPPLQSVSLFSAAQESKQTPPPTHYPLAMLIVMKEAINKNIPLPKDLSKTLKDDAKWIAICPRNEAFWNVICDGFLKGKGELFVKKIRALGWTEALFNSKDSKEWDYIEMRAKEFDQEYRKKYFGVGAVVLTPNHVYALLLQLYLKPTHGMFSEKDCCNAANQNHFPAEFLGPYPDSWADLVDYTKDDFKFELAQNEFFGKQSFLQGVRLRQA